MSRKPSAPSYLKRRRLGWYVQLAVPVALQPIVGAKVLTRSLRTRDEAEAKRRRHGVIAELQQQLERSAAAAAGATHPLIATAETLAAAEGAGLATPLDTEATLSAALDAHLETIAKRHGRDTEGDPNVSPSELGAIRRAHDIAAGRPDETLATLIERHLSELKSDAVRRASTQQAKRRDLEAFAEWFGRERGWREVRRRDAVAYMRKLLDTRRGKDGKGAKLSPVTVGKVLSALRVFFDWLLNSEDADTRPANPFDGVKPERDIRGKEPKRRPWTAGEVSTFLRGVPKDDPLWAFAAIGAYSGARVDEIASLRVDAVEGESFLVTEGKRQASVRRVPIHPAIAPLFTRLVETSPDGYVIPGLLPSGYDAKRGGLLSKRFGYARRKLGIDGPRTVFHAFRNTVESQMVARGVPLERAQLIVGHENLGTSTPYVDRGSVQDVANREALALVTYGDLDNYVRETGAEVTVKRLARPRRRR